MEPASGEVHVSVVQRPKALEHDPDAEWRQVQQLAKQHKRSSGRDNSQFASMLSSMESSMGGFRQECNAIKQLGTGTTAPHVTPRASFAWHQPSIINAGLPHPAVLSSTSLGHPTALEAVMAQGLSRRLFTSSRPYEWSNAGSRRSSLSGRHLHPAQQGPWNAETGMLSAATTSLEARLYAAIEQALQEAAAVCSSSANSEAAQQAQQHLNSVLKAPASAHVAASEQLAVAVPEVPASSTAMSLPSQFSHKEVLAHTSAAAKHSGLNPNELSKLYRAIERSEAAEHAAKAADNRAASAELQAQQLEDSVKLLAQQVEALKARMVSPSDWQAAEVAVANRMGKLAQEQKQLQLQLDEIEQVSCTSMHTSQLTTKLDKQQQEQQQQLQTLEAILEQLQQKLQEQQQQLAELEAQVNQQRQQPIKEMLGADSTDAVEQPTGSDQANSTALAAIQQQLDELHMKCNQQGSYAEVLLQDCKDGLLTRLEGLQLRLQAVEEEQEALVQQTQQHSKHLQQTKASTQQQQQQQQQSDKNQAQWFAQEALQVADRQHESMLNQDVAALQQRVKLLADHWNAAKPLDTMTCAAVEARLYVLEELFKELQQQHVQLAHNADKQQQAAVNLPRLHATVAELTKSLDLLQQDQQRQQQQERGLVQHIEDLSILQATTFESAARLEQLEAGQQHHQQTLDNAGYQQAIVAELIVKVAALEALLQQHQQQNPLHQQEHVAGQATRVAVLDAAQQQQQQEHQHQKGCGQQQQQPGQQGVAGLAARLGLAHLQQQQQQNAEQQGLQQQSEPGTISEASSTSTLEGQPSVRTRIEQFEEQLNAAVYRFAPGQQDEAGLLLATLPAAGSQQPQQPHHSQQPLLKPSAEAEQQLAELQEQLAALQLQVEQQFDRQTQELEACYFMADSAAAQSSETAQAVASLQQQLEVLQAAGAELAADMAQPAAATAPNNAANQAVTEQLAQLRAEIKQAVAAAAAAETAVAVQHNRLNELANELEQQNTYSKNVAGATAMDAARLEGVAATLAQLQKDVEGVRTTKSSAAAATEQVLQGESSSAAAADPTAAQQDSQQQVQQQQQLDSISELLFEVRVELQNGLSDLTHKLDDLEIMEASRKAAAGRTEAAAADALDKVEALHAELTGSPEGGKLFLIATGRLSEQQQQLQQELALVQKQLQQMHDAKAIQLQQQAQSKDMQSQLMQMQEQVAATQGLQHSIDRLQAQQHAAKEQAMQHALHHEEQQEQLRQLLVSVQQELPQTNQQVQELQQRVSQVRHLCHQLQQALQVQLQDMQQQLQQDLLQHQQASRPASCLDRQDVQHLQHLQQPNILQGTSNAEAILSPATRQDEQPQQAEQTREQQQFAQSSEPQQQHDRPGGKHHLQQQVLDLQQQQQAIQQDVAGNQQATATMQQHLQRLQPDHNLQHSKTSAETVQFDTSQQQTQQLAHKAEAEQQQRQGHAGDTNNLQQLQQQCEVVQQQQLQLQQQQQQQHKEVLQAVQMFQLHCEDLQQHLQQLEQQHSDLHQQQQAAALALQDLQQWQRRHGGLQQQEQELQQQHGGLHQHQQTAVTDLQQLSQLQQQHNGLQQQVQELQEQCIDLQQQQQTDVVALQNLQQMQQQAMQQLQQQQTDQLDALQQLQQQYNELERSRQHQMQQQIDLQYQQQWDSKDTLERWHELQQGMEHLQKRQQGLHQHNLQQPDAQQLRHQLQELQQHDADKEQDIQQLQEHLQELEGRLAAAAADAATALQEAAAATQQVHGLRDDLNDALKALDAIKPISASASTLSSPGPSSGVSSAFNPAGGSATQSHSCLYGTYIIATSEQHAPTAVGYGQQAYKDHAADSHIINSVQVLTSLTSPQSTSKGYNMFTPWTSPAHGLVPPAAAAAAEPSVTASRRASATALGEEQTDAGTVSFGFSTPQDNSADPMLSFDGMLARSAASSSGSLNSPSFKRAASDAAAYDSTAGGAAVGSSYHDTFSTAPSAELDLPTTSNHVVSNGGIMFGMLQPDLLGIPSSTVDMQAAAANMMIHKNANLVNVGCSTKALLLGSLENSRVVSGLTTPHRYPLTDSAVFDNSLFDVLDLAPPATAPAMLGGPDASKIKLFGVDSGYDEEPLGPNQLAGSVRSTRSLQAMPLLTRLSSCSVSQSLSAMPSAARLSQSLSQSLSRSQLGSGLAATASSATIAAATEVAAAVAASPLMSPLSVYKNAAFEEAEWQGSCGSSRGSSSSNDDDGSNRTNEHGSGSGSSSLNQGRKAVAPIPMAPLSPPVSAPVALSATLMKQAVPPQPARLASLQGMDAAAATIQPLQLPAPPALLHDSPAIFGGSSGDPIAAAIAAVVANDIAVSESYAYPVALPAAALQIVAGDAAEAAPAAPAAAGSPDEQDLEGYTQIISSSSLSVPDGSNLAAATDEFSVKFGEDGTTSQAKQNVFAAAEDSSSNAFTSTRALPAELLHQESFTSIVQAAAAPQAAGIPGASSQQLSGAASLQRPSHAADNAAEACGGFAEYQAGLIASEAEQDPGNASHALLAELGYQESATSRAGDAAQAASILGASSLKHSLSTADESVVQFCGTLEFPAPDFDNSMMDLEGSEADSELLQWRSSRGISISTNSSRSGSMALSAGGAGATALPVSTAAPAAKAAAQATQAEAVAAVPMHELMVVEGSSADNSQQIIAPGALAGQAMTQWRGEEQRRPTQLLLLLQQPLQQPQQQQQQLIIGGEIMGSLTANSSSSSSGSSAPVSRANSSNNDIQFEYNGAAAPVVRHHPGQAAYQQPDIKQMPVVSQGTEHGLEHDLLQPMQQQQQAECKPFQQEHQQAEYVSVEQQQYPQADVQDGQSDLVGRQQSLLDLGTESDLLDNRSWLLSADNSSDLLPILRIQGGAGYESPDSDDESGRDYHDADLGACKPTVHQYINAMETCAADSMGSIGWQVGSSSIGKAVANEHNSMSSSLQQNPAGDSIISLLASLQSEMSSLSSDSDPDESISSGGAAAVAASWAGSGNSADGSGRLAWAFCPPPPVWLTSRSSYRLGTRTSDRTGAGTKTRVSMRLTSGTGDTHDINVANHLCCKFPPGSIVNDWLLLDTAAHPTAGFTGLRVWHDGSMYSSAWLLASVVIQHVKSGEWWQFENSGGWLKGGGEGNGRNIRLTGSGIEVNCPLPPLPFDCCDWYHQLESLQQLPWQPQQQHQQTFQHAQQPGQVASVQQHQQAPNAQTQPQLLQRNNLLQLQRCDVSYDSELQGWSLLVSTEDLPTYFPAAEVVQQQDRQLWPDKTASQQLQQQAEHPQQLQLLPGQEQLRPQALNGVAVAVGSSSGAGGVYMRPTQSLDAGWGHDRQFVPLDDVELKHRGSPRSVRQQQRRSPSHSPDGSPMRRAGSSSNPSRYKAVQPQRQQQQQFRGCLESMRSLPLPPEYNEHIRYCTASEHLAGSGIVSDSILGGQTMSPLVPAESIKPTGLTATGDQMQHSSKGHTSEFSLPLGSQAKLLRRVSGSAGSITHVPLTAHDSSTDSESEQHSTTEQPYRGQQQGGVGAQLGLRLEATRSSSYSLEASYRSADGSPCVRISSSSSYQGSRPRKIVRFNSWAEQLQFDAASCSSDDGSNSIESFTEEQLLEAQGGGEFTTLELPQGGCSYDAIMGPNISHHQQQRQQFKSSQQQQQGSSTSTLQGFYAAEQSQDDDMATRQPFSVGVREARHSSSLEEVPLVAAKPMQKPAEYQLRLYTADRIAAALPAGQIVHLEVLGAGGVLLSTELPHAKGAFARACIDQFTLFVEGVGGNVGHVEAVRIWHEPDGAVLGGGWCLDKLEVENKLKGIKYCFYNRETDGWIGRGENHGLVLRQPQIVKRDDSDALQAEAAELQRQLNTNQALSVGDRQLLAGRLEKLQQKLLVTVPRSPPSAATASSGNASKKQAASSSRAAADRNSFAGRSGR